MSFKHDFYTWLMSQGIEPLSSWSYVLLNICKQSWMCAVIEFPQAYANEVEKNQEMNMYQGGLGIAAIENSFVISYCGGNRSCHTHPIYDAKLLHLINVRPSLNYFSNEHSFGYTKFILSNNFMINSLVENINCMAEVKQYTIQLYCSTYSTRWVFDTVLRNLISTDGELFLWTLFNTISLEVSALESNME